MRKLDENEIEELFSRSRAGARDNEVAGQKEGTSVAIPQCNLRGARRRANLPEER